jgi:hypothetical protein
MVSVCFRVAGLDGEVCWQSTDPEEVNRGHWFCRKHIPEGAYLVVFMGGKYIN